MEDTSKASTNEFFKDFVQIGVVVSDLDKSIRNLSEIFGIGPFRVLDWPPADRKDMKRYYHGEPTEFTARMAFTELGPIELEIIQPLDGKSCWSDFLDEHGEGIHHIRFNVNKIEPIEGYMAQHDIFSAQHGSGIRPGTNWMLFDSAEKVGFIIEAMNVLPGSSGRTPNIVDGKVLD
jgi:methylmalonyl-CoA/ethylmalonyl-CoA epimerase